jgi:hypothetical protein
LAELDVYLDGPLVISALLMFCKGPAGRET